MAKTKVMVSQTKKAKGIPIKYRSSFITAIGGTASPRGAIKAFCLECMGYNLAEVKQCDTCNCPLFLYRPYQDKLMQDVYCSPKEEE